jgi:hypothetical protein
VGPVKASLLGLALVLSTGLAARASADQVDVTSQLDQDVAGADQTLTLTVSITIHGNGDIEKLQFPQSPHFKELGRTQSQQSSFSLGPQGMDVSRSTVYRISLQPRDAGEFNLAPAVAVVGGKAYRSGPVHVKILPAGQGPSPAPRRQQGQGNNNPFGMFGFPNPFPDDGQDDPFQGLFGGGKPPSGQDIFLAAGLDHHQSYLGQQVTYSVRLYTRVDVNEFDGLKLPGFDGFWGEDLETPTHPVPTIQEVGGVPYQVYLVKKKALFPSKAGQLTIDPAEVDVGTGGIFNRGHKIHRATGALVLTVLPLPAGAPPGFSTSNVGQWSLQASLRPASVPVGEPATLTLITQGVGNLHAVTAPALPPIPGMRAYDPTSQDKTTRSSSSASAPARSRSRRCRSPTSTRLPRPTRRRRPRLCNCSSPPGRAPPARAGREARTSSRPASGRSARRQSSPRSCCRRCGASRSGTRSARRPCSWRCSGRPRSCGVAGAIRPPRRGCGKRIGWRASASRPRGGCSVGPPPTRPSRS